MIRTIILLVALIAVLAVASGGFVTGNVDASLVAGNAITGGDHAIVAAAAGALTLVLVILIFRSSVYRSHVRRLALLLAVTFGAGAASSLGSTHPPLSAGWAILHAELAALFLASAAAAATFSLPALAGQPEIVDLGERQFLRSLALAAPPVVALQILMGAAYRHKALSVMPHMAGAMAVALILLILCVQLLQQFPSHRSLAPIATALLSVVLLQILLGIVSFVLRLLEFDTSTPFVLITTAHVSVGSLTLAGSLILAVEFMRCLPTESNPGGQSLPLRPEDSH